MSAPPAAAASATAAPSASTSGTAHARFPGLAESGLYERSAAAHFGISPRAFEDMLLAIGERYNWSLPAGAEPDAATRLAFIASLRLEELVLARACAAGSEAAWKEFMPRFGEPLRSAAGAIARSDSLGAELAADLLGDLFATGTPPRSPLESYTGRGSLAGWLRAVLAQRLIDHHRRTRREDPLPEHAAETYAAPPAQQPPAHTAALARALERTLQGCDAEARFLLAAYFLDGRTLAEIARSLGVHESTISRKLARTTDTLRAELTAELRRSGLSAAAAAEALATDPRDLALATPLRALLQDSARSPFSLQEAGSGTARAATLPPQNAPQTGSRSGGKEQA